ncbi:uncharacterized protein DNG_00816 [Cephalotrichum gorgonifer]|uniref:Uncharacterized protein n=1 Tax=Cephalotrichum gorgonifer TaxID=2041049 RepID=A0AAE8SR53_9PEZI|nr:uncharacterized protein DNG_00816 [Cephalotrichum gorgonifer]
MATTQQTFYSLWQDEAISDGLSRHLTNTDLSNLRLASSACCNIVTKRLFLRTNVTFTANTFTKPSRVQALSRIGHHIEHLTFYLPHSEATFLPPLINPETGHEINFLYTPHTSMASVLTRPKYANSDLADILTLQYPPLFHAATNVPSFINAFKHFPNMRHLTIKCPGQDARERYRRDIVDYALISLRIAVERTPLEKLSKLSLVSMHPAAFNYLRHLPGFGCVPSGIRRWRQIRKLYISVESWDFYSPNPGLDQLKVIDDFIRSFSGNLEKFTFTWAGVFKGPCPLSLRSDPLFQPPRHSQKLFNEVTSPMSPLPSPPARKAIHFPKLRYIQMRNATMTSTQLSDLVAAHRETVKEFEFESVALLDGGSWDDALAPLLTDNSSGSEVWSRSSSVSESGSFQTVSSFDDLQQSPSAAVAAAARELLGSEFGFDLVDDFDDEFYDDLASDVAAAREASLAFTTKLTKKRLHRRRRRKHRSDDEKDKDKERGRGRGREKEHNSSDKHSNGHHHQERSRSRHKHHHSKNKSSHRRHKSDEDMTTSPARTLTRTPTPRAPTPREMIEMIPRALTPRSPPRSPPPRTPPPREPSLVISLPIPNMDPQPVLLQPTVYNPNAPVSKDPADCISAVQRNFEKEEAHRLLAEDESIRTNALRRAKEAVLAKLSWEYRKTTSPPPPPHRFVPPRTPPRTPPPKTPPPPAQLPEPPIEAALAPAAEVTRDLLVASSCGASVAAGLSMGIRFRDNLFGSTISVLSDHRGLESQTALVPLMFSRS